MGKRWGNKEMSNYLSPVIDLSKSDIDFPSLEVVRDERHKLLVEVDSESEYVALNFSSRMAMYDFARSILHEAVFGSGGQKEFYPLVVDGKLEVIDGVRLDEKSARVFIFYSDS